MPRRPRRPTRPCFFKQWVLLCHNWARRLTDTATPKKAIKHHLNLWPCSHEGKVTLPEGLSWLQATLTWGGGQSLPSPCKTAFPGFLRQCIPWRMRDEQTRSDHVTRNAKAREKARTWYSREVLARHAKTKLADKRGILLVKAFRCWRSCHLQRRSVLWVSAFVHV